MKLWQKVTAALTGVAAVAAALATVFWGVPHYIDNQVNAQVKLQVDMHLEAAAVSETEELAEANQAQVGAVLTRLEGMETRMVARDAMFMDFLREERERRAGN